ncbi:hypothetical protein MMC07_005660 [Pseudocyphellaria aurata]|nr:hypothetical protein [Pseudocyphellaria aurata]
MLLSGLIYILFQIQHTIVAAAPASVPAPGSIEDAALHNVALSDYVLKPQTRSAPASPREARAAGIYRFPIAKTPISVVIQPGIALERLRLMDILATAYRFIQNTIKRDGDILVTGKAGKAGSVRITTVRDVELFLEVVEPNEQHLTLGMVLSALEGLWAVLVIHKLDCEAHFEIHHEGWGILAKGHTKAT